MIHETCVAFAQLPRSNMGGSKTEVSGCLSMAGLLSWYFYDLRRALVSQQEDWWRQATNRKKIPQKMVRYCLMGLLCFVVWWEMVQVCGLKWWVKMCKKAGWQMKMVAWLLLWCNGVGEIRYLFLLRFWNYGSRQSRFVENFYVI